MIACFAGPKESQTVCKAELRGYTCTLDKGHEGDHMAYGNIGKTPYHVWPQELGEKNK